jgi:ketosteroid isomerase-like protein
MRTIAMIAATGLLLLTSPPETRGQESSEGWRQAVRDEIEVALDGYRDAILSRDFDAMLAFWSESDQFVFAGDGRILGGSDAWEAEMTRHYDGTLSWEQWDWQSVHILPLSESAASATLEFRFRWVDVDGAMHNSRGAWTYVFLKSNGARKVVHTNGTHVGL